VTSTKTVLRLTCDGCGFADDLVITANIPEIRAISAIRMNGLDCMCGGSFSAPPGLYVRDENSGAMRWVKSLFGIGL
jgi:hypothetical protein